MRSPQYPTPNRFLKYKISEDEEADAFDREEERVVYVANTRCEELLILSAIIPRSGSMMPQVLKEYEDDMVKMEPSDVIDFKKVTSHMIHETNLFNQIDFEDVLDDYLFCPLKYNLENNLRFKNPKNINKFIDSKLRVILNRLHNDKIDSQWNSDSIKKLVSDVIRSYSFASGEESLKEIFNTFADYWQDYGKDFEVLESSYPVSMEIDGHDINGVIDLIVRQGDGVSLIHFIRTRDEMRNYHSFYMELLNYYALALKEREDYDVESIGLFVLDEGKLYERQYVKSDFVPEFLASVVRNVSEENYSRHKVNCGMCEFSGVTCKFGQS